MSTPILCQGSQWRKTWKLDWVKRIHHFHKLETHSPLVLSTFYHGISYTTVRNILLRATGGMKFQLTRAQIWDNHSSDSVFCNSIFHPYSVQSQRDEEKISPWNYLVRCYCLAWVSSSLLLHPAMAQIRKRYSGKEDVAGLQASSRHQLFFSIRSIWVVAVLTRNWNTSEVLPFTNKSKPNYTLRSRSSQRTTWDGGWNDLLRNETRCGSMASYSVWYLFLPVKSIL